MSTLGKNITNKKTTKTNRIQKMHQLRAERRLKNRRTVKEVIHVDKPEQTLYELLGYDKIKPIILPESIINDIADVDVEYYQQWLEEELQELYDEI